MRSSLRFPFLPEYAGVKRLLDFAAALLLLAILSPLLAVLFLAVRIRLGSPALFCQRRTGANDAPFLLVKFRTMRDAVDEAGAPLPDALRLTPFGIWLRSWSLDELPQLWNVLRGEMSFIGPRPLLPEYLPLYTHRHRRRHWVRPGLSGWAQVNGRNALSWKQRLDLDVDYVERVGLPLDFRIAVLTVRKLIARDGIAQPGAATMPRLERGYADVHRPVNDNLSSEGPHKALSETVLSQTALPHPSAASAACHKEISVEA